MTKRTKKQTRILMDQILAGLQLKRRDEGWVILDIIEKHTNFYGPYETKAEAEDDRQGIAKAYVNLREDKKPQ